MKKRISSILLALLTAVLLLCALPMVISAAETTEPTVSIERYNLTFKDNVYLKYAVKFSGVADSSIKSSSIGMLFYTSPKSEYTKGNAAYSVGVTGFTNLDGVKHYTFVNNQFTAKTMSEYVYAVAYLDYNGETYYSAPSKYSVLEYAYSKLGKTGVASDDQNFINLLNATLYQGAMAQIYFDYNTDRLANDNYFKVSVEGGLLEDGFTSGLYHTGETATLTAPETNGELVFYGWNDEQGTLVSTENPLVLTSFDSNKTYVASYSVKYSEGLEFVSNGNGTCYVKSIGTCTDTELLIPPTSPDGDRVTNIGMRAFYGCETITSVTIPDSVTSIYDSAFAYCKCLTSIKVD